jgi:hypothetical protein
VVDEQDAGSRARSTVSSRAPSHVAASTVASRSKLSTVPEEQDAGSRVRSTTTSNVSHMSNKKSSYLSNHLSTLENDAENEAAPEAGSGSGKKVRVTIRHHKNGAVQTGSAIVQLGQ